MKVFFPKSYRKVLTDQASAQAKCWLFSTIRSVAESENCFYSEVTVGVENLDIGRLQIIVVVKSSRLVFVLSQSFCCLFVCVSKFLRQSLPRCRHLAWTDGSRQAYIVERLRWCVLVV